MPKTLNVRKDSVEERFSQLAQELGGYGSVSRALFRCAEVYKGVDLAGKAVLEIGAGAGVFSAFAAINGANRVVALEPETAGSSEGYQFKIQQMAHGLGATNLEVRGDTIQEYEANGTVFDIVLSCNSVNHFDERMCMELHRSEEARQAYRKIFARVREMMKPGGLLILSDCARHNFYPDVGLSNPICRSIEWHKHQSPSLWGELLSPLGFRKKSLSWYRFHPLRKLGWFGSNRLAAYFLTSQFRLILQT